jgi:hypothetical protein
MYFREHRGTLEDSLKTECQFKTFTELKLKYLSSNRNRIEINYYGYDKRCEQDLWLVFVDSIPIGFAYDKNI